MAIDEEKNLKNLKRESLYYTIELPEEFKNQEYRIRKHMPFPVYQKFATAQAQHNEGEILAILLRDMIVQPKITEAELTDMDTEGTKLMILATVIQEGLDFSAQRIQDLRKKVNKR